MEVDATMRRDVVIQQRVAWRLSGSAAQRLPVLAPWLIRTEDPCINYESMKPQLFEFYGVGTDDLNMLMKDVLTIEMV